MRSGHRGGKEWIYMNKYPFKLRFGPLPYWMEKGKSRNFEGEPRPSIDGEMTM